MQLIAPLEMLGRHCARVRICAGEYWSRHQKATVDYCTLLAYCREAGHAPRLGSRAVDAGPGQGEGFN